MESHFLLSPRFVTLIRNYRRLLILFIFLIGFGFSYPIGHSLQHSDVQRTFDSLPPAMADVLSWMLTLVLGLLMSGAFALCWIPAILVLRTMEKLLVSCRDNSSQKFSERKELVALKKLFSIQLIFNVGFFLFTEILGSTASLSEGAVSTGASDQDFTAFSVLIHAQTYAEWIMSPFQKGMPLLYLVTLFAIIRFSKLTEALREEIAHTV